MNSSIKTVSSNVGFITVSGIDIKDDDTYWFEGIWNSDQTVKTVTRSTASFISRTDGQSNIAGDLVVYPISNIIFSDGCHATFSNIQSVTMTPYNSHFTLLERENESGLWGSGYWFASTWEFKTEEEKSQVYNNPALINGTYKITINISHNGNTASIVKYLVISF